MYLCSFIFFIFSLALLLVISYSFLNPGYVSLFAGYAVGLVDKVSFTTFLGLILASQLFCCAQHAVLSQTVLPLPGVRLVEQIFQLVSTPFHHLEFVACAQQQVFLSFP